MTYIFIKLSRADVKLELTCITLRPTVIDIFAVKRPKFRQKISDLGIPWGAPPPKGEKTCPGPICYILQNFTPIDATVADIFITGLRIKQQTVPCHILTYVVQRVIKTKTTICL